MCPSFALPTPLPQHYHSSASPLLESRLGVFTQLAVIITSTVSTITGTNVEDSELLAVRTSISVYTSQAVCAWTFSTTVLPSSHLARWVDWLRTFLCCSWNNNRKVSKSNRSLSSLRSCCHCSCWSMTCCSVTAACNNFLTLPTAPFLNSGAARAPQRCQDRLCCSGALLSRHHSLPASNITSPRGSPRNAPETSQQQTSSSSTHQRTPGRPLQPKPAGRQGVAWRKIPSTTRRCRALPRRRTATMCTSAPSHTDQGCTQTLPNIEANTPRHRADCPSDKWHEQRTCYVDAHATLGVQEWIP